MQLRTHIPLRSQPHNQIDYTSELLLLGSCFSENMGDKLSYFKFRNLSNPFGILFHPVAIEQLVTNAINDKNYTEEDLFFLNELWHTFDAHSKLSSPNKVQLLDSLNAQLQTTKEAITTASHVIITLGTAWVYRHITSDRYVANCHKVPQKKFLKELLSIDEISGSLSSIIALIRSVNHGATFIFTVSPVRHLKDGFVENTRSKSHLIAGIHEIVDPRNNVHYFPSYELMMDELRDYRFYDQDMIHPNKVAIDYVWDKFTSVWISESESSIMKDVDTVQKGLLHKPFNPNSEQHQSFLQHLSKNIKEIRTKLPFIDFDVANTKS